MFTCNTWDSSGINPESEARGIYIWTVECITPKHLEVCGLTGLYHCRHTNYHCAFRLYHARSLFYQTRMLWAVDPSYCWLYPNKQAVDCFMLFACLYHVLFSRLEHSVKKVHEVLTADLSAWHWHWKISLGNTDYSHVLTTQLCWLSIRSLTTTIYWLCWYSVFTQYNHQAMPLICMAAAVQMYNNYTKWCFL